MIIERIPITLGKVKELVGQGEKQDKIKMFINQFSPLKVEKASKMEEELKKLDLIKLKNEHIVKIVDLMPEDSADLSKALPNVSLNQDKVNKILDVVKRY